MTNLAIYLIIATIIAHFSLGLIVIIYNPKAITNRLILSLSIVMSLWSFSVIMIAIQESYNLILFWVRASHAFGVYSPWHIYALIVTFPHGALFSNRKVIALLILSTVFSLLALTQFFISGLGEPLGDIIILYNIGAAPFYLFYISMFSYIVYLLYMKLKNSSGLLRTQLNYFAIGTITTALVYRQINKLMIHYP